MATRRRTAGAGDEGPESGLVFGSSQGFELPTGDTVEPGACYVSRERWRWDSTVLPGLSLCAADLQPQ